MRFNAITPFTRAAFRIMNASGVLRVLNDESFCKLKYRMITGEKLNLESPKSFNEKILWLMINDHNDFYTELVDKYKVKKYIEEILGKEHVIPLVGGPWKSFDEINFNDLPNEFVLKTNNGSGSVLIVNDKNNFDIKYAKKTLDKAMKSNYYYSEREWPYKNVDPVIFAEKKFVDESGNQLKDYKVFTFSGEPKLIQVDFDRFNGHKRNLYDTKWNYINGAIQFPSHEEITIKKPDCLEEMLEAARTLSNDLPHVRVDFYVIGDMFYFGELTFYHGSGIEKFTPKQLGVDMGSWINLPVKGARVDEKND